MVTGRRFEVELPIQVRTYDIDFAGIVSNIVYIRWLEDLRSTMLEAHLPLDRQLARGSTPVLLSTDIRYRRAVRLFDRPVGRMWMAEAGKVRWTLQAEFTVDDSLMAEATQVCALVNLQNFRPLPIPPELRD